MLQVVENENILHCPFRMEEQILDEKVLMEMKRIEINESTHFPLSRISQYILVILVQFCCSQIINHAGKSQPISENDGQED